MFALTFVFLGATMARFIGLVIVAAKPYTMLDIRLTHRGPGTKLGIKLLSFDQHYALDNGLLLVSVANHELTLYVLNFSERIRHIFTHFMSFLHNDMTQVVEIHPQVKQELPYSTLSISWVLMSWRRKEPGHQQPWYLLCSIKLFRSCMLRVNLCQWRLTSYFCYELQNTVIIIVILRGYLVPI